MPLPKTSKSDFMKALREKPLDDIRTINLIESELKKRGGVFKMPKPGSSVILLLSGGLDSIVSWAILMEEYKLKVYPIVFADKQKKWKNIQKSIKFFSKLYKNKYPNFFNKPFYTFDGFPQIEPEKILKEVHPLSILDITSNQKSKINFSLHSVSLVILAKSYANYLFFTKNSNINTIFCGILSSDGDTVQEQRFTSIRASTLYLRILSSENKWQFASICYEKEIGNMFYKKDLIKWAFEHDIPIEKTWTCFFNKIFNCGKCSTCLNRREGFKQAGIKDNTIYLEDYNVIYKNLLTKIRFFLKGVLKILLPGVLLIIYERRKRKKKI